jgi:hypothetical protein
MNEFDKRYLPEDFDPTDFARIVTEEGKLQTAFLENEERSTIENLRDNIRMFERNGVEFDDVMKIGLISGMAMNESEKLWTEFATNGVRHAIGVLSTIISLLYKNLLEKLEAEDAVFGDQNKEG